MNETIIVTYVKELLSNTNPEVDHGIEKILGSVYAIGFIISRFSQLKKNFPSVSNSEFFSKIS